MYNGLVVAVQQTGSLFVLKNRDKYTLDSSWVAVGSDVSGVLSDVSQAVKTLVNTSYDLATVAVSTDAVGELLYAKSYILRKTLTYDDGSTSSVELGEAINIPKDQVVQSGRVTTNPDTGKQQIILTLANGAGDIVIDAASLVDVYTVHADSTSYITSDANNSIKLNISGIKDGLAYEGELADLSQAVTDVRNDVQDVADRLDNIPQPSYTINGIEFIKSAPDSDEYEAEIDATSIPVGKPITHIEMDGDVSNEVTDYSETHTVYDILDSLHARIRQFNADWESAQSGGIKSINGGNGIAISSQTVNDRIIAISLANDANNMASIRENKLYVSPMT